MVSAVVLDLDGTLLNSNKEVSKRNRNAVLKCRELGIKVILATARPPRSVRKFVPEEIISNCSFVNYNGALVVDIHNGIEEHIEIGKNEIVGILDYCSTSSQECKISIEVKDLWYADKEIDDSSIYNLDSRPKILAMEQLKQLNATKILITDYKLSQEFHLTFGDKVNIVVTDNGKLVQIMGKDVSKATGISKLCEHYDIDLSQVIVFGDDYNDLDMFQSCGYSVAMKNGVDELKIIADEITETNDDDGVARVLERITGGSPKVTLS